MRKNAEPAQRAPTADEQFKFARAQNRIRGIIPGLEAVAMFADVHGDHSVANLIRDGYPILFVDPERTDLPALRKALAPELRDVFEWNEQYAEPAKWEKRPQ